MSISPTMAITKPAARVPVSVIPQSPRPRPTMSMAEMAELENKVANLGHSHSPRAANTTQEKRDELALQIADYVKNCDRDSGDLFEHFGISSNQLRKCAAQARASGLELHYCNISNVWFVGAPEKRVVLRLFERLVDALKGGPRSIPALARLLNCSEAAVTTAASQAKKHGAKIACPRGSRTYTLEREASE